MLLSKPTIITWNKAKNMMWKVYVTEEVLIIFKCLLVWKEKVEFWVKVTNNLWAFNLLSSYSNIKSHDYSNATWKGLVFKCPHIPKTRKKNQTFRPFFNATCMCGPTYPFLCAVFITVCDFLKRSSQNVITLRIPKPHRIQFYYIINPY